MSKLIIIKLGGSVITYKNRLKPAVRRIVINHLSEQIASLYKTGKYQMIVVHGTGSFGHLIAKKHNLIANIKTAEERLLCAQVAAKIAKLNLLVVSSLQKKLIPAISVPPHAFITQSQGKIVSFDVSIIKRLLGTDGVPILYGDFVFDNKQGYSILSSDIITVYLAKNLGADQIIFLSDVDGIFDSDPKTNKKAKIIPEITNKNLKQVLKGLTSTNGHDVTGQMKGKIMAIKNTLPLMPVLLVNGLKQQNLTLALDKVQVRTRLYFE